MSIFTKYTELDPVLFERQVEASKGSTVFDKYSVLDEQRMLRQAATALGGTLTTAALLDPRRAAYELDLLAAGGGGGGGGGAYVQKWVKFIGGNTGAQLSVIPSASSSLLTLSTWVNYSSEELAAGENILGGTDGFKLVPSWNVLGDIHCRLSADFNTYTQFDTAGGLLTADTPHHIFFCCDVNHPQGAKLLDLLVDGVTIDLTIDDQQDAFVPAISAGDSGSIVIPDAFGGPHDQSYSDFQLWVGQRIAPTEGNLLNFRTAGGAAVDPALAASAFGQQAVLFSGDAAAFVVNQGTAGDASVTGSIVDA